MKAKLKQLTQVLAKDYILTLLVFVLLFTIISLVYFSLDRFTSHDDSFFHIRFAEILRTQGFTVFTHFPWIYFSKMAQGQQYLIYYNFLFYLFLIPFTFVQPLFLGLKLYAVVFAALAFTGFYYTLKKLNQSWPLVWTLALFTLISGGLIQRTLLARPFVLAPTLLLLLLLSLHFKKYWFSVLITLVYFYWHSATFFFPLGVTGVYVTFQYFYKRKPSWSLLVSVGTTTLVATLITCWLTPGFLLYMRDIILQSLWQIGTSQKVQIAEGGELYGVDFFDFLRGNSLLITLFIFAIVYEIRQYLVRRRLTHPTPATDLTILRTTTFFLSLGLLLGTFLSFRNADFFVWIVFLFIALSFQDLFRHITVLDTTIQRSLQIGLLITLVYLSTSQLLTVQNYIASREPYYSIEGAADWFKTNTKPGDIIFISNWGFFPRLFYYDIQNYYTMGIEPRFLYDYKPKLYWQWVHITRDGYACDQANCPDLQSKRDAAAKNSSLRVSWNQEEGDQVAKVIQTGFNSHLILVYQNQTKFKGLLDNNQHFKPVYNDSSRSGFSIYTIK